LSHWGDFVQKKSKVGIVAFTRGWREKCGAEDGFLMVKAWWLRGKSWFLNGECRACKNLPLFENISVANKENLFPPLV
jgi:hypothetical protein